MNFKQLDIEIGRFIKGKNISVSRDISSDWLVFESRRLLWKDNGVNYSIEICPKFNDEEKIESWIVCAVAYYDANLKRFYVKKEFASEPTMELITQNANRILEDSYNFISKINKNEIPFAVDLSE